jgi:hypothetical protein
METNKKILGKINTQRCSVTLIKQVTLYVNTDRQIAEGGTD